MVTATTPIPIPVEYEGEGPLVAMASPGSCGHRARSVYGAISGLVVDTRRARPGRADGACDATLREPRETSVVALTFDDGPWPVSTEQVLEILEREDVEATFFMLGKQVRAQPGDWRSEWPRRGIWSATTH